MPYFTVDEAAFEKAHSALNLELPINLFTDVDPPEGIVQGIEQQTTSATLDDEMTSMGVQELVDSIMAAYSPLLNDDDVIEEHAIWVRPTRTCLDANRRLRPQPVRDGGGLHVPLPRAGAEGRAICPGRKGVKNDKRRSV